MQIGVGGEPGVLPRPLEGGVKVGCAAAVRAHLEMMICDGRSLARGIVAAAAAAVVLRWLVTLSRPTRFSWCVF